MVKTGFLTALCVLTLMIFFLGVMPASTRAEVDTEKAKEMYNEGLKAASEGKTDQAILSYKTAMGLDPGFIDPYLNLGAIYFEKKQYGDALEMFKKASEKDPNNIDALANIGRVEYKLTKYPEAATAFKAAIALDNKKVDLYTELARVYYQQQNFSELVTTLETCHQLGGGDDMSYYMLGKGYQKQNNIDKAVDAFKKSLANKSDNYNANFALGQIYLDQEKYLNAAKAFKEAYTYDNKKHLAYYNYAVAMESNDPEAIDANIKNWEEYIRIAKKNPKANSNVAIAQQHVKELKERKEKLEIQ